MDLLVWIIILVAVSSVLKKKKQNAGGGQQMSRQGQANAGTYTKEDILSRSAKDVSEDFGEDTLKREADRHEGCVEGHYEQQGDLLKAVEDLMILGPNCTISYERDFVGEGEKMVESFR